MTSFIHCHHAKCREFRDSGIYYITIVTNERKQVFGELNGDVREPRVILSDMGKYVHEQWEWMLAMQAQKGRKVSVLEQQVMPDHFHGVLRVDEALKEGLGEIVRAFKDACTEEYRRIKQSNGAEALWEDSCDDVICYRKGRLENILRYVQDNPRRAVIRAMQPDFYRKRLHITIEGIDFAAYGNLFLLRRPWKEQVFCHRWRMDGDKRDYSTPYETTDEFRCEREAWLKAAEDGAVLVTPGISKGEQQLVKDCMEQELPLIHLQMEPLTDSWHPDYRRYELCSKGKLLILSPWQLDEQGEVNGVPANTSYSRFHNLNAIAEMLCGEDYLEMRIRQ